MYPARVVAWKNCIFSYVALALRSVPDEKIILDVLKIIGLLTTQQRGRVVGMSMTVMEYSYMDSSALYMRLRGCLS